MLPSNTPSATGNNSIPLSTLLASTGGRGGRAGTLVAFAIVTGELGIVNSLAIFFHHVAAAKNAWKEWLLDLKPSSNMLTTQFEGAENDGDVRSS